MFGQELDYHPLSAAAMAKRKQPWPAGCFTAGTCIDQLDVGQALVEVSHSAAIDNEGIGLWKDSAREAATNLSSVAQQERGTADIMMHIHLQR